MISQKIKTKAYRRLPLCWDCGGKTQKSPKELARCNCTSCNRLPTPLRKPLCGKTPQKIQSRSGQRCP